MNLLHRLDSFCSNAATLKLVQTILSLISSFMSSLVSWRNVLITKLESLWGCTIVLTRKHVFHFDIFRFVFVQALLSYFRFQFYSARNNIFLHQTYCCFYKCFPFYFSCTQIIFFSVSLLLAASLRFKPVKRHDRGVPSPLIKVCLRWFLTGPWRLANSIRKEVFQNFSQQLQEFSHELIHLPSFLFLVFFTVFFYILWHSFLSKQLL